LRLLIIPFRLIGSLHSKPPNATDVQSARFHLERKGTIVRTLITIMQPDKYVVCFALPATQA
jgi:hypothetical protein